MTASTEMEQVTILLALLSLPSTAAVSSYNYPAYYRGQTASRQSALVKTRLNWSSRQARGIILADKLHISSMQMFV